MPASLRLSFIFASKNLRFLAFVVACAVGVLILVFYGGVFIIFVRIAQGTQNVSDPARNLRWCFSVFLVSVEDEKIYFPERTVLQVQIFHYYSSLFPLHSGRRERPDRRQGGTARGGHR